MPATAMIKAPKTQRGFTLVEMVVTIVILSIALVSVAYIVGLGSSNSAYTLLETRATALGHAYLDEILGRRFDERSARSGLDPCYGLMGADRCTALVNFGPDGGESGRGDWDDVDDYQGLVEGDGEATALLDAQGVVRTGYENFHVAVEVSYAGADSFWALTTTDAKLITVRVRYRGLSEAWAFSAYKGNY